MDGVTTDQVLLVILAVCGGVATVGKAVDVLRSWRKPQEDVRTKLALHDGYFAADKRRLDAQDAELSEQREGQRVLCKGVQALLEHELHNGNEDELASASKGINDWLVNK